MKSVEKYLRQRQGLHGHDVEVLTRRVSVVPSAADGLSRYAFLPDCDNVLAD